MSMLYGNTAGHTLEGPVIVSEFGKRFLEYCLTERRALKLMK